MIYNLLWFTIILTFHYQIHNFNTENPQNEVGKLEFNTTFMFKFFYHPLLQISKLTMIFFHLFRNIVHNIKKLHILCILSWILGVPSSYLKHLLS